MILWKDGISVKTSPWIAGRVATLFTVCCRVFKNLCPLLLNLVCLEAIGDIGVGIIYICVLAGFSKHVTRYRDNQPVAL